MPEAGLDELISDCLATVPTEMTRFEISSSSVFYSNPWRNLTPGPFYILGLNPRGNESTPSQTLDSLDAMGRARRWSAYLDGTDSQRGITQATLRRLADALLPGGRDALRDIFSSNVIFAHSADARHIRGLSAELTRVCWPWHVRFLELVKPAVVVALGNGPGSPFAFLSARLSEARPLGPDIPLYATFSIKGLGGLLSLPTGPVRVKLVGLPASNRVNVVARPEALERLLGDGWLAP